jgi:hypothetical protein
MRSIRDVVTNAQSLVERIGKNGSPMQEKLFR